MKVQNKSIIKLFVLGLLLSSLIFSNKLLDFTLVPRFISLSIFLAISFFYLYRSKTALLLKIDIILLLYAVFTALCCLSLIWSTTKSESYFESTKQVLTFLTFMFTLYALKKDAVYFNLSINKISFILFIILIGFSLYQLSQIKKIDKESLYAVTGINGHKNLFSSFLFLNLFFLIRSALSSQGKHKILPLLCILISLLFLFFLKTKAVWLGIIITAVVSSFLVVYRLDMKRRSGKNRILLAVLIVIIPTNIFFLNFLQPLLQKGIHYTSQLNPEKTIQSNTFKLEEERLILWDKTYHIIHKNPLLGVGTGNWQIYFPNATLSGLWRAEDLNYTFQRPHNDFLWILSETGIIGFNLFLCFLLLVILYLFRTLGRVKENYLISMEIILGIAFILGYFTISFFDFPKERIEHSIWINVILAISVFHIQTHGDLKIITTQKINHTMLFVFLLILGSSIYIGILRYKGEFYTRKMFNYKNNDQKNEVIKAGHAALSFVYSIDPTSVPIHWYTGNAHAALEKYNEAKHDFLTAYGFAPFNRNVLNDLASSYAMSGNTDLAKKYYEEAARISPRFDDPKLNLVALYIQENNFKMAQECLKTLFHDSERRTNYQNIVNAQK